MFCIVGSNYLSSVAADCHTSHDITSMIKTFTAAINNKFCFPASPTPVDDFEEDVVEELDDQNEEEGQSEPEENNSQPESDREIISKDADYQDDDEVQDTGKWSILLRRGSIY